MKVYPIGSIIQIRRSQYMIVSHFKTEKDNHFHYYYLCVAYPRGYVGADRLVALAFEETFDLVHEGALIGRGKSYLEDLTQIATLAQQLDAKVMKRIEFLEYKGFEQMEAEAIK